MFSFFFFFLLLSLLSCSERNFWRETWSLSPATFAQRFVQFCEIIKESRVAVRSAEVCTVVTNHCHFRLNMPGERSVPRHFYAAETYAITFVSLILLTTKTSFEKRVQAFRKWTWTKSSEQLQQTIRDIWKHRTSVLIYFRLIDSSERSSSISKETK